MWIPIERELAELPRMWVSFARWNIKCGRIYNKWEYRIFSNILSTQSATGDKRVNCKGRYLYSWKNGLGKLHLWMWCDNVECVPPQLCQCTRPCLSKRILVVHSNYNLSDAIRIIHNYVNTVDLCKYKTNARYKQMRMVELCAICLSLYVSQEIRQRRE